MAELALDVPNGNLELAVNPLALPLDAPNTIYDDCLLKLVSGDANPVFLMLFILVAPPREDVEFDGLRARLC